VSAIRLPVGKREVEGRLASAQAALMLQEESIRRSDRDRKQLSEKINNLERIVAALESEKRQLQVCYELVMNDLTN